jgi:hypothetical protein
MVRDGVWGKTENDRSISLLAVPACPSTEGSLEAWYNFWKARR